MDRRLIAVIVGVCLSAGTALAQEKPSAEVAARGKAARADIQKTLGFVPGFLKAVPDRSIPGAWEEMKGFQMNPNTLIPPKYKELIGLAVAAQIPCKYCVYAHTEFAKANGATPAELGEAVTMSALTRHWSTFLNGLGTEEKQFRTEVDQWIANIKAASPKQTPPSKPAEVVDAKTAREEVGKTFGAVPDFLKRFPDQAVAGAWREMRDVEMDPNTALPGKYKTLIGLAVSAQVPCQYCLYVDKQFAKLEGITEAEMNEAFAMAAIVRHWSTMLNGLEVDEAAFRKDVDRMVKPAKKTAAGPSSTGRGSR